MMPLVTMAATLAGVVGVIYASVMVTQERYNGAVSKH
jgi:hypothetical protein